MKTIGETPLKLMQGACIGIAFILPGVSAGTVILLLGFYRQLLDDLTNFKLKPYLPHLAGALVAAISGVYLISYLLLYFYTQLTAFLLGMLLASLPVVLGDNVRAGLRPLPILFGAAGFVLAWFYIGEPARTFTVLPPGGHFHFFLGGTIASATMLLPGVSGSSVLIIMDLYDDVIVAVSTWQWAKLGALGAGFVCGLFGLARLLSALYRRYRHEVTFLLAGLILGSTRVLMPCRLSLSFIIFALLGAVIVLFFSNRPAKTPP